MPKSSQKPARVYPILLKERKVVYSTYPLSPEHKQLDLEAARERVETVNRQRADYLQQLYGTGINDCSDYDLAINTDRFGMEQTVGLILHSMQQAGYEIPAELTQAV
ncbi:MAG: cytidylate kinase family protein [Pseudomonadota bacterium]